MLEIMCMQLVHLVESFKVTMEWSEIARITSKESHSSQKECQFLLLAILIARIASSNNVPNASAPPLKEAKKPVATPAPIISKNNTRNCRAKVSDRAESMGQLVERPKRKTTTPRHLKDYVH